MKIAFLVPSSHLGGSEICAFETIKSLKEYKNYDNYLITPKDGTLVSRAQEYIKDIKIINHSWWVSDPAWSFLLKLKMLKGFLKSSWLIYKYLKEIRPDVVMTHTLSIPSGAFAAKIAGIPHIWYIHEYGQEDQNLKFNYGYRLSTWIMDKLSDSIIANSSLVLEKFKSRFSKNEIIKVDYAIELPKIKLKKKKQDQIAFLGRIAEGKNQLELLQALKLLRARKIFPHVVFVGRKDEVYYLKLRDYITRNKLTDQVSFIDFIPNPFELLSSSNVSVVCSKKEAFGRVIIESMKLGIPVIVPNTGSGPEIVNHKKTGLIYKYQCPDHLAEMISILLNDSILCHQISDNAYRWANDHFSLKHHANSVEEVIDSVLE